MVCVSEILNLLEYVLWAYYSWCDKLHVVRGRRNFAIGDFPYNFSQGAVACVWVFAQIRVSLTVS